jgi:hypothetical protein
VVILDEAPLLSLKQPGKACNIRNTCGTPCTCIKGTNDCHIHISWAAAGVVLVVDVENADVKVSNYPCRL